MIISKELPEYTLLPSPPVIISTTAFRVSAFQLKMTKTSVSKSETEALQSHNQYHFLLDDFSRCDRALPAMLLVLALDLPSVKAFEALLATLAEVTFLGISSGVFMGAISSPRYTNKVAFTRSNRPVFNQSEPQIGMVYRFSGKSSVHLE